MASFQGVPGNQKGSYCRSGKGSVSNYTAPRDNELDCNGAVHRRQTLAFSVGRSPWPRACTMNAAATCSTSLRGLHPCNPRNY